MASLLLTSCLTASFTPAAYLCGGMHTVVCGQRAATAVMGMGEAAMATERKPPVELLALSMKGMTKKELESIYSVSDMLFNVVDRNGNEVISKEELAAHLLLARYKTAIEPVRVSQASPTPSPPLLSRPP